MNTLNQDLIGLVDQLANHCTLPAIQQLILPQKSIGDNSKYAKFGLLLLEDNSSGFFYRLTDLDDNANQSMLASLHQRAYELQGMDVAEVAHWLDDDNDINVGLGMAAVNAISQFVFARVGYTPPGLDAAIGYVDRARGCKHVGMVGYFAPVVRQLVEQDIPLTVIELDPDLYQQKENLTVTGDVTALAETDYILCTGSTLLNHSLQGLLDDYAEGRFFELIGPTCGCFADPLFARGVNQIGGSQVINTAAASSRIESGKPWGQTVRKFVIQPDAYPTFSELLTRLEQS